MISSEAEYIEAMREMIRKVQNGYEPPFHADAEELEILADCIRNGYLRGTTTYIDRDGIERESRTLDGKIHPELTNHVVPPKGLAFLNPENPLPEERASNNQQKHKRPLHAVFNCFKAFMGGLATLLTIIGSWHLIRRFWEAIFSFFNRP